MEMKPQLPNINLTKLRKLLLGFILIFGIFLGGYFLGFEGYKVSVEKGQRVTIVRENPPDKEDLNFSLFWKVWDTLSTSYFDKSKLQAKEMVYGAISGMVAALQDPYTVFLPPSENKMIKEDLQGNFDGAGIQIGFKGKQLTVIAPLPQSPAEKAGVKAGDYIIGIRDEKKGLDIGTIGLSLVEAVEAIRGKKGTTVTLTLLRDQIEEPIIVDIVRDSINVPSVTLDFQEKDGFKIANLKLLKFGGETKAEWDKAISEILKTNPSGIILDLRNNPGGYLQGSVDTAGDFLKNGTLVTYEEYSDGKKEEYKTTKIPRLINYPLVILVNKGSASASEILAGALRDQIKTKIIGETTFGKGTIQEPKELEGGSGIHITVAKWLTPNGFWINEKGLDPDVKIEDNLETKEDEQLQKALEELILITK